MSIPVVYMARRTGKTCLVRQSAMDYTPEHLCRATLICLRHIQNDQSVLPYAMQIAPPAPLLSLPVVPVSRPIVRSPLPPFQKEKCMGLFSPRPPWLAALPDHQTCSNDSLRQWCAKPIGFSPLKLPLGSPHLYT
jgi:hypothetical protein